MASGWEIVGGLGGVAALLGAKALWRLVSHRPRHPLRPALPALCAELGLTPEGRRAARGTVDGVEAQLRLVSERDVASHRFMYRVDIGVRAARIDDFKIARGSGPSVVGRLEAYPRTDRFRLPDDATCDALWARMTPAVGAILSSAHTWSSDDWLWHRFEGGDATAHVETMVSVAKALDAPGKTTELLWAHARAERSDGRAVRLLLGARRNADYLRDAEIERWALKQRPAIRLVTAAGAEPAIGRAHLQALADDASVADWVRQAARNQLIHRDGGADQQRGALSLAELTVGGLSLNGPAEAGGGALSLDVPSAAADDG